MAKILRTLVLATGMAALVAMMTVPSAPAQDKKGKQPAKAGTVEVYADKSGSFRFRVKDSEGKVIAMPPKGYGTKAECLKALDEVKAVLNSGKVVEVKDGKK